MIPKKAISVVIMIELSLSKSILLYFNSGAVNQYLGATLHNHCGCKTYIYNRIRFFLSQSSLKELERLRVFLYDVLSVCNPVVLLVMVLFAS